MIPGFFVSAILRAEGWRDQARHNLGWARRFAPCRAGMLPLAREAAAYARQWLAFAAVEWERLTPGAGNLDLGLGGPLP